MAHRADAAAGTDKRSFDISGHDACASHSATGICAGPLRAHLESGPHNWVHTRQCNSVCHHLFLPGGQLKPPDTLQLTHIKEELNLRRCSNHGIGSLFC